MKKPRLNNAFNFHQARWNEPIIFEISNEGEQGVVFEDVDSHIAQQVGNPKDLVPAGMWRKQAPALPEINQMRVLRHYLRLSQENLGAEVNVDIGQGTCTMKYSPKVDQQLAALPKVRRLHPLQDSSTLQGSLEIIHSTDLFLREISGLDRFSFQPRGGTQAIFTMASIIRAYHEANGETEKDEIITTMFSHPSDAACASVLGFKIITLMPDEENGLPSLEDLKKAVSPRTAGMLITNPEDTGIFNCQIAEFTKAVRKAGGLCGYDQANANGLLGITRAREAGFDMCFFNLHKTFSVPHCSGGPAVGAIGVDAELEKFLPHPLVDKKGDIYEWKEEMPESIGKISSFYGVFPAILRTYSWLRALGPEGVVAVAETAVLNNNYLLRKVLQLRGVSAPYTDKHRKEQARYSWQKLKEETGIGTADITYRLMDFGMHMWSSHHPYIVPEPMTLEPTESYSKAELDQYVEVLEEVVSEAYENPEIIKTAPHRSSIHRMKEEWLDDSEKWAITWRAYLRKHQ